MDPDQVERVADLVRATHGVPLFVGLDGRSGAGKSTLAAAVADALAAGSPARGVLVIEGDEFYAGGSGDSWDSWTAAERAARVFDWRCQAEVLASLRHAGTASWHPFDWESPDWDAEPPPRVAEATTVERADVVILEGAYSCRPELHAELDLLVLLATPTDERRRRLLTREGGDYRDEWEARWGAAEDHYFGRTMPPDRFDLVL